MLDGVLWIAWKKCRMIWANTHELQAFVLRCSLSSKEWPTHRIHGNHTSSDISILYKSYKVCTRGRIVHVYTCLRKIWLDGWRNNNTTGKLMCTSWKSTIQVLLSGAVSWTRYLKSVGFSRYFALYYFRLVLYRMMNKYPVVCIHLQRMNCMWSRPLLTGMLSNTSWPDVSDDRVSHRVNLCMDKCHGGGIDVLIGKFEIPMTSRICLKFRILMSEHTSRFKYPLI